MNYKNNVVRMGLCVFAKCMKCLQHRSGSHQMNVIGLSREIVIGFDIIIGNSARKSIH